MNIMKLLYFDSDFYYKMYFLIIRKFKIFIYLTIFEIFCIEQSFFTTKYTKKKRKEL